MTTALSRREFMRLSLMATAGGILTACGANTADSTVDGFVTQPPPSVLESPMPPPGATATPTLEAGDLALEQFLQLSAVLTGVTYLDPVLGASYLAALRDGDFEVTPGELWQRAGGPAAITLDAYEQAGIFDDEATRTLADTIIEYWYTGVVGGSDDSRVVTYVDALAWKVMDYTTPHTVCGETGYWQTDPRNHP